MDKLVQLYGRREAEAIRCLVAEKCFALSRTDVLLGRMDSMSPAMQRRWQGILHRLHEGEPVQYVLGEADFLGRAFRVTPDVLIPRPETEELVRRILSRSVMPFRALDLCTGSGCIAVSLALAGCEVTATDISTQALAVARDNAKRLGAAVTFLWDDLLATALLGSDTPLSCSDFSLIVSNPPYVTESERADMSPHVLHHEPSLALFVHGDPLLFYRHIARVARALLRPGGLLAVEANRNYVTDVAELFKNNGFIEVNTYEDQFRNPRFVFAEAPCPVCSE